MRVVHIIEASATGTLTMAALLANEQVASGKSVDIIYSIRAETPKNLSKIFDPRVRMTNMQMSSLKERFFSLWRIRVFLKANAPDQVFMHSSFAGFLGRISSIGILPGSRLFYIPHCISFMRKDVGMIQRLIFIAFEWVASIKKADFVACSESERKAIAANIPFRKCHLVENAINFVNVPVVPFQALSDKKKIVITVGQIRPQKGPEEFVTIAKAIKALDPKIDFIWVGDGDPMARQKLVQAGVNVIGWVPKDDVWLYLSKASIYLSTAKWEGMPVSLIEASFVGLPVIASNCAGNVDVVEHDKTGWLFESTDEAVQHIFTALNKPEQAIDKAKNAFDVARQRFSARRYVKEMESLAQL